MVAGGTSMAAAHALLKLSAHPRANSKCCTWSSPTGTWVALNDMRRRATAHEVGSHTHVPVYLLPEERGKRKGPALASLWSVCQGVMLTLVRPFCSDEVRECLRNGSRVIVELLAYLPLCHPG